ncbi:hypothetical protein CHC183_06060 [Helicobacter pylori]
MEENRDGHAIVANVIKSLEKGGFFSSSDREKFARVAREHGIEGSVIEEVIDIVLSIAMKFCLMRAIWQERRRKPCALNSKKVLMKI